MDASTLQRNLGGYPAPKMICDLFRKQKVISFGGCISQIFFSHAVGGTEMVLLIAMAFDRAEHEIPPPSTSSHISENENTKNVVLKTVNCGLR
ncbi:hypothetical protein STEG23_006637, partial [Scotinomys teguina]